MCPSIPGCPSDCQQEGDASTAPSLGTHRPSCASTESSPKLSPWKQKRLEAGEGREWVRYGGWSSPAHLSHSSYYLFLLLLSNPRSARPCYVFWRSCELDTDAVFHLGTGWLREKINNQIFRAGNDHISCSLCPRSCSAQAEVRGEAAKGVPGTKRDKQRIIFQAKIHHLKPKQRNNFPASTALNRWTKPLQRQAGVSGLRKPIWPWPQGNYPGWLSWFQAGMAKSLAAATAFVDLFVCTKGQ